MSSIADPGPVRRGVAWAGRAFDAGRRGINNALTKAGNATGLIPSWTAIRDAWRRFARFLGRQMPKGLFARSLIIIVAPIVLLQAVVAFVFLERHYELVTQSLAAATSRDIAAVIELLAASPNEDGVDEIIRVAGDELNLGVAILPTDTLPPPSSQPFFALLDRTLAGLIEEEIDLPFWIDTVGRSNFVEIRIQQGERIVQFLAPRSQAFASNSGIFITWMVVTSLILMAIAILFLRNQIRPIQRLADAAESFGKGRPAAANFTPRGAREVRRASAAFIKMRERIVRQMEQRTEMLAGVSHDLRTILTRFRLQLELLGDEEGSEELRQDIKDMQQMLEDYLAFASGDAAEQPEATDVHALLQREAEQASEGQPFRVGYSGDRVITLRPVSFRRCVGNLIRNAFRYGHRVEIRGYHAKGWLTVHVDDDGPGIAEDEREAVFKPFYRLDTARNIEASGTGLGLPIARDIARAHGGEIALDDSRLGGLRATVRIPV